MAQTYLDFAGLQHYDQKLKASLANPTHSYTVAQNAAKNWYRLANAAGSQIDTAKPLHVQFLVTAWNSGADTGYYLQWFVDCQVFGRNAGIRIFGNSSAPFSQIRVLYENTIADIDASDRPAIDLYLNYVLANAATNVKVEEIYNSGWTFVSDGALAASTVPTGFENVAAAPLNSGIGRASNATYTDYAALQRSDITTNATLADSTTYRGRTLNCTNAITLTLPSINSVWSWFLIKNFNAIGSGKNVTIHPSTTSVLIDGSNADIVLAPGEYVLLHSRAANSYTRLMDNRAYQGATSSAAGRSGLVPAATSAQRENFLRGDGTWATVSTAKEMAVKTVEPTASNTTALDNESIIFYDSGSAANAPQPVFTSGNQTIGGVKTFSAGIFSGKQVMSGTSMDCSAASCFTKTATANMMLGFANVPSDAVCCVTLVLINGGNHIISWPSSVKWTGNLPPQLTANGTDVLTFLTCDGGNVWYGTTTCIGVTA